jgi:predicted nucleotidyltransferase/DNA-binding XRE family transcriptional regulator
VEATPGAILREARRRARLSQADLARRAGVAQSVISAYERDHREPSVQTLRRMVCAAGQELTIELGPPRPNEMGLPDTPLGRRLRRHRKAILDLAGRRGAHHVRVFGSVARGDDGPDSDVDLLVDLDDGVGLVGLAGLQRELVELLGVDVDVVPSASLKARSRPTVLAEAIAL